MVDTEKKCGQYTRLFAKRIVIQQSGSGCGSVGRAAAFDTRDPRFESSLRQTLIKHLFFVNCVEKMKIKKKRPGMAHFLINKVEGVNRTCKGKALNTRVKVCQLIVQLYAKLDPTLLK